FFQPIPLLRSGFNGSVTLSQQQVAALLAHAFFSTYEMPRNRTAVEKLRCILYFDFNFSVPFGVITFRRQSVDPPDWNRLTNHLSDFVVQSSGTIEDDGFGMLEVDFANKYIGGGVLSKGCVQEEIRFLICPELILSCLFCERMSENEAIFISGAQRFSNYTGYGRDFKWHSASKQTTLMRWVHIIFLLIMQAHAGFYSPDGSKKGIATGNWGCGVYRGNPHLKLLSFFYTFYLIRDVTLLSLFRSSAVNCCLGQ
ncbi:unnamed protein product, partial [Enterobius vermicularis]|uniref:poly(ADP-ribose) glycohydrolase n=1 Tax=Enterobius vermicularis TaxID=51028 RepID=A0A0N4V719_ENTVE